MSVGELNFGGGWVNTNLVGEEFTGRGGGGWGANLQLVGGTSRIPLNRENPVPLDNLKVK